MSCGLVAVAIGPVALTAAPASATSCTAIPDTSFSIDGITNLNAAVVNPTTTVSGMVDATGCDVGVYFGPGTSGSVGGAIVENATMVDVVNNGGTVSITDSTVNQIGDNPLDGVQYGIGIYFGPSSATGLILGKGSRRV